MEEEDIKSVITRHISGEAKTFAKVWLVAYVSLCYCYLATKLLTKNKLTRLVAFLPVISLFTYLPLQLHSVHFIGTTSFFLTWLCSFKLLMLACDKGPLSNPSISMNRYVALASLPIKPISKDNIGNDNKGKSVLNYAAKGILFAVTIKVYEYEEYLYPRMLIYVLYCVHVYLTLEFILLVAASAARGLLGAELEPQFNEPYLSTSLQDFWGRRWNLVVTRTLRPTVYEPVLGWCSKLMGREWAPLPSIMSTFLVSGMAHELIFYYLCRARPTWEITWFFVLHGACLTAEVGVKKALKDTWRLPAMVGRVLTVGLVVLTGFWLFFPQLLSCEADRRALDELAAVGAFVKDVSRVFGEEVKGFIRA